MTLLISVVMLVALVFGCLNMLYQVRVCRKNKGENNDSNPRD